MAPWCSVEPSSCPVGAWTTGWRRMGVNYKIGKRVPASADGPCRRALSKPPGDAQAKGEREALAAIGLESSNPGSELPSPFLALHEASAKMQRGTWGAGLPLGAISRLCGARNHAAGTRSSGASWRRRRRAGHAVSPAPGCWSARRGVRARACIFTLLGWRR